VTQFWGQFLGIFLRPLLLFFQTLNPISFFWFGILRRHLFDTIFQIFTFFSYQILKLTQKSGEKNPENLVRLVTYKDIVRYGKNRFHGSLPTPVPFFG